MSIEKACPSAGPAPSRRTLSGPTMGTRFSCVYFARQDFDESRLARALLEAVGNVDQQMSSWKASSDLNRLNAADIGAWVSVPGELETVLASAIEIGRQSQGLFDIGVGDALRAWGFGAAATAPDGALIAALPPVRLAAHDVLDVDMLQHRVRKRAAISLDLSGIAKGFGVDELARVMNAFGMRDWLVGIDGEMRARGAKPDGSPWVVAHERPTPGVREPMGVLELSDIAVATSGNYRHFHEIDGRRVSHTIVPESGCPLDNGIASVTVLATTCMAADAWATALLVAGLVSGLELARKAGVEAIFVQQDGTIHGLG
ncbi:FAD:protein FMN transferase [Phreatobacter aquaticus]|uniref:FAD:protein FMN transferase n=2 Tax=Phreatobacter aquaticus TaxID=2570229 RepID=A0A4D7QTW9_9HYPH|nr:FAD:protein FMN transferase [Phreatobacter aquaticus]